MDDDEVSMPHCEGWRALNLQKQRSSSCLQPCIFVSHSTGATRRAPRSRPYSRAGTPNPLLAKRNGQSSRVGGPPLRRWRCTSPRCTGRGPRPRYAAQKKKTACPRLKKKKKVNCNSQSLTPEMHTIACPQE